MSDTTAGNGLRADGGRQDKQRTLGSLAAAFVVHGVLFAAFAIFLSIRSVPAVTPPVTIDLQAAEESGLDGAAMSGGGAFGGGAAGAGPAISAPAVTAAPAAAAAPAASAARAAPSAAAAPASGFVIPTPRAQPAEAAPVAGGSAFREAGGKTGVVQGIPSVSSPVPAPVVAPVRQGSGAGSAASSGSGASSTQRSGTGVLVTGSSGSGSGGNLDLGQLDKSLASPAGSGAGRPAGAGSGAGGGGTSGGGTGGTGGSGSAGGTSGGAGAGGGQSISWEVADAGKGRKLLSSPPPKLPASVSAQGLTLSVTVTFTLLADGLVAGAAVQKSCGNAEVDSAVLNAILRWRFTTAAGAAPAKGIIPYIIRAQ